MQLTRVAGQEITQSLPVAGFVCLGLLGQWRLASFPAYRRGVVAPVLCRI